MKFGWFVVEAAAFASLAFADPVSVTVNGHSQEFAASSTVFEFAFFGTIDLSGVGSASFGAGLTDFSPLGLSGFDPARGTIPINFNGSVLDAFFSVAAGALDPSLGVPPNIGLLIFSGGTGEFAGVTGRVPLSAASETMTGSVSNFTWTGQGAWSIPEPSTAAFLGAALVALSACARRRKSH